jgi:hypothetical protein
MNFNTDHERFVNKNKSIARAHEFDRRDVKMEQKGFSHIERQKEPSCFDCKHKGKCIEFRSKRSGGSTGAVSFGGGETMICDRFTPVPSESRSMSAQQVKALLKNVKKGYA